MGPKIILVSPLSVQSRCTGAHTVGNDPRPAYPCLPRIPWSMIAPAIVLSAHTVHVQYVPTLWLGSSMKPGSMRYVKRTTNLIDMMLKYLNGTCSIFSSPNNRPLSECCRLRCRFKLTIWRTYRHLGTTRQLKCGKNYS